jgi:2-haloacid dehalogenase
MAPMSARLSAAPTTQLPEPPTAASAPRAAEAAQTRAAPPASPTAVVFDLGGVLIDWDPRHLYRRLFDGDDAAMEHFLATVCTQDWNAEQDAGRSWSSAVETLAQEHPEERELILAYRDRWTEMLGGPIDGTVAILDELRSTGMPLYALTNWSAETFPVAYDRYDFLAWFGGIVVSGQERIRKPDPRIFEILLERHGLDPAGTVYIDDVAANVTVAAELGLRALRFDSALRLRDDLRAMGLLPSRPAG